MKAAPETLSPEQAAWCGKRRPARDSRRGGSPARRPRLLRLLRGEIFIALDDKPKDVPARLKRVRNILENPSVALVADRYAEDWSLLAFVMVRGRAGLLDPGSEEHTAAIRLLRGKYHQYEEMRIEDNPVICIRPERVVSGALDVAGSGEPTVLDAVRGRRSVRRYLPKEVPEDLVEAVLEAGRWAPSPHGTQPWRFAVVTKEETRERLAGAMGEEWRANLEMDGQAPEVVERRLQGSRRRLLDAPVLVLLCLYR